MKHSYEKFERKMLMKLTTWILQYYKVFHGFGKAKFAYGGSILGSRQLILLPQLPLKNDAQFKSGQNWLGNKQFPLLI